MNCLVVAATTLEIAPFLDRYRNQSGRPRLPETDVLITGIGLTATTWSLSRQLALKKPDLVIQAGVGGCFDTRIPLGSVLAVKKETIADQSVVELEKLKTLFDLRLVPHHQYPYRNGWLWNKNEILNRVKLRKVTGISVNEITTSRQKVAFYTGRFKPVIESMEGAALHYSCLMGKVPFLQLRSVSNYIAERNKKNWNMKESIFRLNHTLIDLLESL